MHRSKINVVQNATILLYLVQRFFLKPILEKDNHVSETIPNYPAPTYLSENLKAALIAA